MLIGPYSMAEFQKTAGGQRAKNPQGHRAELRQKLYDFVDEYMQFADACDRR
jgi:hypothetical protein